MISIVSKVIRIDSYLQFVCEQYYKICIKNY